MPGFDYKFLEKPKRRLLCPLCSKAMREPVQVSTCGHRFCDTCLQEFLRNSTQQIHEEDSTLIKAMMKKSFDLAVHMFLIAPFVLSAVSETTNFVANFSGKNLTEVPPNVPLKTTNLDLSQNRITEILRSDFRYLSMLKRLDLSHNLIVNLDFSVFESNNDLQYVDVSYNNLQNLTCASVHHLKHLTHLDLSYNKFRTMKLCKEFHFLFELKYLGLSASEIHQSDMVGIRLANLQTLFLGLENLTIYEAGSLCALKTKTIHIVLPTNANVNSCLPDAINTARTLEISNMYCDAQCDYPTRPLTQTIKSSRLRTLIFRNITMSFLDIQGILQSVFSSSVEYLHFYVMTYVEEFEYKKFDFSNSSLKELKIEHLINKNVIYHGTNPYNMYSEMVVENFTLLDTDVMHLVCPPEYNVFHILDLSENVITDYVFQNCKTLKHLEVLSLRGNKLEDLARASAMTTDMTSLTYLDLSKNILHYENSTNCYWTETLTVLILSTNDLESTVFECLPKNTKTLDLQNNEITSVPKSINALTFLEDLNLASNRLTDLPDCSQFVRLISLNVEMNSIFSPSSEFSHKCLKVQTLYAGNNPFVCNCDLRGFIRQGMESPNRLSGWQESYRCQYPEAVRGTLLKDFHLSNLSCNITILVTVILAVTVTLLLLIFCLCKYFSVPWYLRMMLQWTRTKYRIKNMTAQDLERELLFHAFVSYSEHDSAWVKNYLLPNLEKDGSIRLCQHERNFIPGKGIIENIIDCIEKSYKSIFVLSPHFVRSEWCHYELYFAHHRLFCELSNSLILILLEPIPQYLIPARYHKLKALMARRTYLEWPKEKSKQGLFWANLREAIEVNIPTTQEEM